MPLSLCSACVCSYTNLAGPIIDEIYPHTATAVHCVVTLLCLIIAAWLAGTSVLMLALPPYISAEEEQILLDVLKEFPEGAPTADGGGTKEGGGGVPSKPVDVVISEPSAAAQSPQQEPDMTI